MEILRRAVKLMPDSLGRMMQIHQKELVAGMLSPGSAEDRPEHWQHPRGEYGSAASRVEADAQAVIDAVQGHEPFAQVVRRFGTLAHWITDINNPLHAADRDPNLKNYYRDYQGYLEQAMERFPLVFLGYRAPTLSSHGPGHYLLESAARSSDYANSVRRSYNPDGTRVSKEAFDDRSVAFGVGSLSYSNAVNDIMRIWLWTWERCHGDLAGTPYPLEPDTPPARNAQPGIKDSTRP